MQITNLGRQMSAFPLTPSLSRILLFAADNGIVEAVLTIVAMLSVEVLFIRPAQKKQMEAADRAHQLLKAFGGDDFCALLYIYECSQRSNNPREFSRKFFLHQRALQTASKVRQQLRALLEAELIRAGRPRLRSDDHEVAAPQAKQRRLDPVLAPEVADLLEPGMLKPVSLETRERVGQALCYGYFNNVARKAQGSHTFRVMVGATRVP